MTREELIEQINLKRSVLCVGLDTDLDKIPSHLLELDDPIFEFNRQVIEATVRYAVAYKPNLAFYEAYGVAGLQSLQRTMDYLNENYPEVFTIADAKRGDIGNTSARYARAFFETFNFDSVTVAPYMGSDSVKPFLGFDGKWVILLALTSNQGAADFQFLPVESDLLFERVLKQSKEWGGAEQLMYVVGATQADSLKKVRSIVPDHFLLVPGVGAQGGNVQEVMQAGMGIEPNLLINSSRGIIYAGSGPDFAKEVSKAAEKLQGEMESFF
jgi:orotidine-5'-phosphate decarboxylase